MQQDKEQDEDERVFTNKFDLTFQVTFYLDKCNVIFSPRFDTEGKPISVTTGSRDRASLTYGNDYYKNGMMLILISVLVRHVILCCYLTNVHQPSRPTELVMRSPSPPSDGGPVITSDAGSGLPPFSLIAVDACGNRTAPAHNEAWQVSGCDTSLLCIDRRHQ